MLVTFGLSAGVFLDSTGWCNDYYFNVQSGGGGIYSMHGYEYGCGQVNRLAGGTLHVAGSYAYVGVWGNNAGNGDYGQTVSKDHIMNMAAGTWTGNYFFVQLQSGAVYSFGGSDSGVWYLGGPPALGEGAGQAVDASEG